MQEKSPLSHFPWFFHSSTFRSFPWEGRIKELNLWATERPKNGPTHSQKEFIHLRSLRLPSFPILCFQRTTLALWPPDSLLSVPHPLRAPLMTARRHSYCSVFHCLYQAPFCWFPFWVPAFYPFQFNVSQGVWARDASLGLSCKSPPAAAS